MDWQHLLTIAIAGLCAVWVLWTTIRPFVRKMASACGMCPGCDPGTNDGSSTPATTAADLLQIAMPDAQ
jgi:hypothetical protein|tara:strand:- start:655 stop:861 length:207 start_codon:yes stop_codon:yes gene_type:complete